MRRIQIATKLFPSQVEELDKLITAKYPGRKRGEFVRTLIEQELNRQKDGQSKDARINEILRLCKEMHSAVIEK